MCNLHQLANKNKLLVSVYIGCKVGKNKQNSILVNEVRQLSHDLICAAVGLKYA